MGLLTQTVSTYSFITLLLDSFDKPSVLRAFGQPVFTATAISIPQYTEKSKEVLMERNDTIRLSTLPYYARHPRPFWCFISNELNFFFIKYFLKLNFEFHG